MPVNGKAVLFSKPLFLSREVKFIEKNVLYFFAFKTDKVVVMTAFSQLKVLLAIADDDSAYDPRPFHRRQIAIDSCFVCLSPRLVTLRNNIRCCKRPGRIMKYRQKHTPSLCVPECGIR